MELENTEIDQDRMENSVKKLKEWRDLINKELKREFKEHKKRAKKIHSEGVTVIDYLEDYTMRGGKRVRPALIIAGYLGTGGEDLDKLIPASLSIEALQSYLLIHDDIMDEDVLRRGDDTLHKMYEEYHKREFNGERPEKFGENMGIIVGDISNSFAVSQIIRSDFDDRTKIAVMDKFEEIHRHTGYGQVLDVTFNEKKLEDVTEKDVLTVHYLKTSQYTMAGPLELGAIFAGATEKQKEIFRTYGEKAGKAFQVYDDLLGLYGDEEKLGKPIGSDLEEGKKTLLVVKAFERGNKEQKRIIKSSLGKKDITEEEVMKIREIVRETGSYQYSRNLTTKLANEAKEDLDEDVIDPEIVQFLRGLADYIITREV